MCCTSSTADDRPGGGGRADHRAPDANGGVQLLGREVLPQQGQGGRLEHGPEHALGRAERDDQGDAAGDAPRQADRRRAGREPGHAGQEHLLVPEPVAELPGGDQADRQGQQVGVGHPLDAGQRRVQVRLDSRVGHRDDRAVDADHHHPERHRQQRQRGIAARAPPLRCCGADAGHGGGLCLAHDFLRFRIIDRDLRYPRCRGAHSATRAQNSTSPILSIQMYLQSIGSGLLHPRQEIATPSALRCGETIRL
jgi:hypothetical protein